MASGRRLERTTRKFIVEGQVRSAEQHLEALRQELLETDRDLEEIETSMKTLHDLIRQTPAPEGNDHSQAPLYESDASGESDGTGSESSSLNAE